MYLFNILPIQCWPSLVSYLCLLTTFHICPLVCSYFTNIWHICSLVAPLCPLSLAAPLDWAGCPALKKAAAHQTSPSLHYHVSPQIACLWECIITLVAFLCLFLHCVLSNVYLAAVGRMCRIKECGRTPRLLPVQWRNQKLGWICRNKSQEFLQRIVNNLQRSSQGQSGSGEKLQRKVGEEFCLYVSNLST